jgi:hypothetical protein
MLTAFDKELAPGARNAVRVCLNVQPARARHRDRRSRLPGHRRQPGATRSSRSARPTRRSSSEDVAQRPLVDLPKAIAEDMEQSQVSILAVHVQRNELGSRMQLTDIVNRRKMRHGHMVNINRQMMLEGMRADFTRSIASARR